MLARQHALRTWLQQRRVTWMAGALAFLVTAPAFWVGLVGDDYVHRSFLLDHLHSDSAPGVWWNMFQNPETVESQVSFGVLPWWTSPRLRVALFRPLATLSQYVDYLLWPEQPFWMHVHNSVLYALLVAAVAALYWRLLPSAAASLAALLYAVDDAHALGTAWLAGRNTLLTALFAVLTLHLFIRARETGAMRHTLAAVCTLLLAHASSEGAVGIWAYIAAYELLLARSSLAARVRGLLPLAAASGAWIVFTALQSYGVTGSGAYLDPREAPAQFLSEVMDRFPKLLVMQFGLAGELSSHVEPRIARIASLVSYTLLLAISLLSVGARRRSAAWRFFLVGCIGSLLPLCAVGAVGRVLFVSGLGAHALVALLFTWGMQRVLMAWSSRSMRLAGSASLWSILAIQSACTVHGALAAPSWWLSMHRYIYDVAQSLPSGKVLESSAIMILNSRDYLATPFVLLYRRLFSMPGPLLVHVLGVSTEAVRVQRVSDVSIELEAEHGYLSDPTSILVRPRNEPFHVGQVIDLFGARVEVTDVTPDARPARIRVDTFNIDDPRLLWVVWDDAARRYVRIQMPRPGESLSLAAMPDANPARPFSMLD